MRRRSYLAGVGSGLFAGAAGCLGVPRAPRAKPTPTPEQDPASIRGGDGRPRNICALGPQPTRIPAIVEPAFAPNWDDVRGWQLDDSSVVIGIARGDQAKAYPLSVMGYEIVNDTFDVPVLVTYCPLCASGLTATRRVDGRETLFSNTSYTWRPPTRTGRRAIENDRVFGISNRERPERTRPTNDPNLVMFDRNTGSYWSQLLSRAICGPLAGTPLRLIPSTVTTWGRWRRDHSDTSVLLPPPRSMTV